MCSSDLKTPIDRISPWTSEEPLTTSVPLLEGASGLRRSLIPSLIAARLHNQSQSNRDVRLFETANVYLPQGGSLPREQYNLGCISESDPRVVRGLFEEVLHRVWDTSKPWPQEVLIEMDFLEPGTGVAWQVSGSMLAWVGSLSRSLASGAKIDGPVAIGELNLDGLLSCSRDVPRLKELSPYPAISRDLNLIVDETVHWGVLKETILQAAGPLCKDVSFQEIYRDTKRDGAGKKRMLLTITLQSDTETLKGEQADEVITNVLRACESKCGAKLLAS